MKGRFDNFFVMQGYITARMYKTQIIMIRVSVVLSDPNRAPTVQTLSSPMLLQDIFI